MEAHAAIVPPALARLRTRDDFASRLRAMYDAVRVIGPVGGPIAFHAIREDELDHFYVAPDARGTGVAVRLLQDAESCLASAGTRVAWLVCAIGNDRAARFYARHGWRRTGMFVDRHATPEGDVSLEFWRFEKELATAT